MTNLATNLLHHWNHIFSIKLLILGDHEGLTLTVSHKHQGSFWQQWCPIQHEPVSLRDCLLILSVPQFKFVCQVGNQSSLLCLICTVQEHHHVVTFSSNVPTVASSSVIAVSTVLQISPRTLSVASPLECIPPSAWWINHIGVHVEIPNTVVLPWFSMTDNQPHYLGEIKATSGIFALILCPVNFCSWQHIQFDYVCGHLILSNSELASNFAFNQWVHWPQNSP